MTSTVLSMRPYTGDADLQAVTDLLNLVDAVDQLDDNYSVDELRVEFSSPDLDPARDIQLWEAGEGQLIGFAQAETRPSHAGDTVIGAFVYLRIHPDYRTQELEDAMLLWAEQRLRAVGQERGLPVEIRSGAAEHYQYMVTILERHGLERVRYFFRMVRDLSQPIPEPRFAEGYTLRTVASAEDEERWVDAYNWSFIDHYDFHTRTVESHRHWLTDPAYSRERDLIAVTADGTVAAFALCRINVDDNARNQRLDGWVNILGVRRGHRKLGLGKAMLLAGLHKLKADGMTRVKLGVDAENPTGALQLYESVGFTRDETWVTYLKRL